MKKTLKILFLSYCSILLISCAYLSENDNTRNQWVENWLNPTNCKAPCWENIIPGKTQFSEISVSSVSEDNELIINGPHQNSGGEYFYSWDAKSDGKLLSAVYATTVSDVDLSIGSIEFEFDRPGNSVSLSDVFSLLGEPSYVGTYQEASIDPCFCYLIYDNSYVWLLTGMQSYNSKVKISGDLLLSRSAYLSPTEMQNRIDEYVISEGPLQTWHGLGEYNCK